MKICSIFVMVSSSNSNGLTQRVNYRVNSDL